MKDRAYTIVTVAHGPDEVWLEIQARSLALYCHPDLIGQVMVIDNTASGMPLSRERLLNAYGGLSSKVRFVDSKHLLSLRDENGWWTQQFLKLAAASLVDTAFYVVLDAKSHLVFPLERAFLEASSGLPRMHVEDVRSHHMRSNLDRCFEYFGIPPDPALLRTFPSAATPFTLHAEKVRSLVASVSDREHRTFEDYFLGSRTMTEFYLYSSYLVSTGGIERFYSVDRKLCPIVWRDDTSDEACLWSIARAEPVEAPFFAVHRAACATLSDASIALIAGFWADRDLFGSAKAAAEFLMERKRVLLRERSIRHMKAIPMRALRKASRMLTRRDAPG